MLHVSIPKPKNRPEEKPGPIRKPTKPNQTIVFSSKMVQRKVGIQSDKLKTDIAVSQHQDNKTRRPEMKKKMKKSRSIKLSADHIPLTKTVSQPGKPPPLTPAPHGSPQKLPLNKTPYGSPNYMKATSSSEAKKETSHVTTSRARRSSGNSSNPGSGSGSARTLTRTSSLKVVRCLRKSPSFKTARAPVKKCSKIALCADMSSQKATCSSTLKESKFPEYLMLNPGGTEAEGTSVIKVCPYTYCSLNGHHHAPLPPLKSFLSARRRLLRVQKSMRREALSPRKVKPSAQELTQIINGQVIASDHKAEIVEGDVSNYPMSPLTKENSFDFFIEIYAANKEDAAELNGGSTEKDPAGLENQDMSSFGGNNEETVGEIFLDTQVVESLSDELLNSEIDLEEDLGEENYVYPTDKETRESFLEEKKHEAGENDLTASHQDEGKQITFHIEDDFQSECQTSIEDDGADSEIIDMELDEGQFSNFKPDGEADHSVETAGESDLDVDLLAEAKNIGIIEIVSDFSKEIPADEILLDVNEEQSAGFDVLSDDSDFEMDETHQNLEIVEYLEYDLLSSCEDEVEEITTMDEVQETEAAVTEEPILEPTVASEKPEESRAPEPGNITSETNFITEDMADGDLAEARNKTDNTVEENHPADTQKHSSHDLQEATNIENHSVSERDQDEEGKMFWIQDWVDSEAQGDSGMNGNHSAETSVIESGKTEGKSETGQQGIAEAIHTASNMTNPTSEKRFSYSRRSKQELSDTCDTQKWTIGRRRLTDNSEESTREFNPREPNYLPVIAEPDAEKVDLKHQDIDGRRNTEEWMLDYALQRTVTKLAPARKRKVALLVEAFEAVMPIPKCEIQVRRASAAFTHGRPIQACN